MRTNYVLIDYENVQPEAIAVLNKSISKSSSLSAPIKPKSPSRLHLFFQQMGERAEYIKISGNGSNALDFHIAYYIGALASREPDAYFHIVSKDTGFDPLIAHLKTKKIFACRSKDVT